MSNIRIAEKGCDAFESALSINTTLVELNLRACLKQRGKVAQLARAMQVNITLTSLDLSHAFLGYSDADALAAMVGNNTSLTHLDLDFTDIQSEKKLCLY